MFLDCDSTSEKLDSLSVREHFASAAVLPARRRRAEYIKAPDIIISGDPAIVWDAIVSQTGNRARTLVVCPKPVRVLTLLKHIEQMQARGWTLDTPTSSSRFTAIAWRKDSRTLLFVAHANLFPMQRLQNSNAAHRVQMMCDTWLEYLKLLDDVDAGDFHLSLGAQALGIYRHKFLNHPIMFHGEKRIDELEQRACMGALYQPFVAGRAPGTEFFYLDTNAMYPWCMKAYEYPWRLAGSAGRGTIDLLRDKLFNRCVVASVLLSTPDPIYPVRIEGRTIFPTGEFTTTLTSPDLINAVARKHIRDVYAIAWYDRADLFSGFVNYFWRMRKDFMSHGQTIWAAWSKSIMVSLYGRFGAHEFETRDEGQNPLDHDGADQIASLDSDEIRWYHTLAGRMWSSKRGGYHCDAFPAIMAHIAAWGRNRMFDLINMAGRENVFVALSDGLIVNRAGYEHLEHEIQADVLGMLKLKLSGNELEILSDVEFRLSDHVWRPGVKPDAIQIEDGIFVQHLDPNLPGLSRSGDTSEYVRRAETVRLSRTIRTGRILSSGRIAALEIRLAPPTPLPTPRP